MTNDVLEQITEDYFRELGYFTQHNIKYKPENTGGTNSDIDIIAFDPTGIDISKVCVISCKSDQAGLNIESTLNDICKNPLRDIRGRSMKKRYREIVDEIASKALTQKVKELTGANHFIFYLCVTSYHHGEKSTWENFPLFKNNLPGCDIKLICLREMIEEIERGMTTTPSHSQLTRTLQLIKAAKGEISFKE